VRQVSYLLELYKLWIRLTPPMPAATDTPCLSTPCCWRTVTARYSFHYGIDFICVLTVMVIDAFTMHMPLRRTALFSCIYNHIKYDLTNPVLRFII